MEIFELEKNRHVYHGGIVLYHAQYFGVDDFGSSCLLRTPTYKAISFTSLFIAQSALIGMVAPRDFP